MLFRLIIATILLLAVTNKTVFACTCIGGQTAQEQAEAADAIFVGKAIETIVYPGQKTVWDYIFFWRTNPSPPWELQYLTVFEVEKSLKGPQTRKISLRHGVNEDFCGVSFKSKSSYFILAYSDVNKKYSTYLCGMPNYSFEEIEAALTLSE